MNGPYAHLSREELEARLAAAEDVCLLYSWSPSRSGSPDESDREKATFEMWHAWYAHPGVLDFERTAVAEWPDSRIAELAAKRNKTRADTLARLTDPEGPDTP